MTDACVYLTERYTHNETGLFINIGYGKDITIAELAELIKEIVGFRENYGLVGISQMAHPRNYWI